MPLDPNKEVSVRVGYPVGIAEPDPQIDSLIEFARSILHENESFVLRKEFQYAKNDSLTNQMAPLPERSCLNFEIWKMNFQI